jgi:hypothetical protein
LQTVIASALLEGETESLVRKAVELVLGGDTCRQILVMSEVRRQPLELAI